jgi:hypothetical protein
MKFKSSLVAIASTSVLASAAILASPNAAQACTFAKLNALDVNKIAIAGGGIAALAGLFVGGAALKGRFRNKIESETSEPKSLTVSNFAIVVPPEALTSQNATEDVSKTETMVR